MDAETARDVLIEASRKPVEEQQAIRDEVVNAFSAYWESNPSMEDFEKVASGLVLQPGMLYIMAKQGKENG